jgi:hypothetical protein
MHLGCCGSHMAYSFLQTFFVVVRRALEVLGANIRPPWCVCEDSADECLVLGEPGMHQHYAYRHTMGALW